MVALRRGVRMSDSAAGPTTAPRLSALVVAHNEAAQLADCLNCLAPADERVVVLDRCTDDSAVIANKLADQVIEGAWPIEGDRRNTGIAACTGDWVLEVDFIYAEAASRASSN